MDEAETRGGSGGAGEAISTETAEAGILHRFIADGEGAAGRGEIAGLLAYALHRRALVAFREDFVARQGRAPDAPEEAAFIIGETGAGRIAAYRAEAALLLAANANPAPHNTLAPKPARRFRLFPGFGAPVPPSGEPAGPVNWKGLFLRFLLLLLAVIATALMLRILVVHAP